MRYKYNKYTGYIVRVLAIRYKVASIAIGIGESRAFFSVRSDKCNTITYVHPINMAFEVINGMCQQLNVALDEMLFVYSDSAQLGGTNGREITRMREHNTPSNGFAKVGAKLTR